VRKTVERPFLSRFYIKTIFLPRQARDGRRETLKQEAFSPGMKKDADGGAGGAGGGAGSDTDENRLLKELAQLMEQGDGQGGGAVGRNELEAEGAVHIHLNTSTDASRRQMVGNSALDEFELKHLSPEDDGDNAGVAAAAAAAAADHPLANGMRAPAAAAGRGGGNAAGGAAAAPAAAAAAAAPRAAAAVAPTDLLGQAMAVVAERRGLSVPELKSQIQADTVEGGKQAAVAEIQEELRLATVAAAAAAATAATAKKKKKKKAAKKKKQRQQSLPETFAAGAAAAAGGGDAAAAAAAAAAATQQRANAVLTEVARREGYGSQQEVRDFIAECKSAEGIAEYGKEECDACLARIAHLSQQVQREMSSAAAR
jgi:hypothetical protein